VHHLSEPALSRGGVQRASMSRSRGPVGRRAPCGQRSASRPTAQSGTHREPKASWASHRPSLAAAWAAENARPSSVRRAAVRCARGLATVREAVACASGCRPRW
jgi:hypothetical protein